MNTVSLTMSDLIDETLDNLWRIGERPAPVVLGSNALTASSSDATFTLASSTSWNRVQETSVVEFGQELVLVTDKTDDATPVFTCIRGYEGTTVAAHAEDDVGTLNPSFPRHRIQRRIQQSIRRLDAFIPLTASSTFSVTTDTQRVIMPATTVDVLRVAVVAEETGRWWDIDGWKFVDDVPTTLVSTGKLLSTPRFISNDDTLYVVYQKLHEWSDATPDEESTISVLVGAENLPASYASAYLMARREVGRLELDRSEEWHQQEVLRGGSNVGLIRDLWAQFYRELDEAKRLYPARPRHRPFIKSRRVL